MSVSSVLFRCLDINWTLTACLAVAGVFVMLVGVGLFVALFRHAKGKIERMSEHETRDFITYGDVMEPYVRAAPAMQSLGPVIGVKAVLTANTIPFDERLAEMTG